MIKAKFIRQYTEWYEGVENLNNGKSRQSGYYPRASLVELSELLNIERLFIVAEPGHGKTTLINQLITYFNDNGILYKYAIGLGSDKIVLDSDTEYLIFDALDESKDVVPTFIELLKLCEDNNVKLIVSNRLHYINMIQHLLKATQFQFIKLLPFDEYQVRSFLIDKLEELQYSAEQINQIIENSKGNSPKSILRTPRYLNEFSDYILKDKIAPENIIKLSKSDLFEKVIYYKLEHDTSDNKNSKYLTKRVLERLALVMEIHGLNQIHMEDFVTFLDQTDSNISLIFLNSVDLEDLLCRVMKKTDDMLQFEHTEFQEYMAAKELSRMGYRFQTVYDLMVDNNLQVLKNNWIDVLTFAVEIQPEFSKPLLSFIEVNKNGNIDEKLVELLLNIPATNFDDNFKNLFFDVVGNYYYSRGKIIFHTYFQLANYFTKSRSEILIPYYGIDQLKDSVTHIQSNQILLIEALAEQNRLSMNDKSNWVSYLVNLVQKDEFYSMQSTIFRTLVALNDTEAVLELIPVFEQKPDYILNNLFYALSQLVPNDLETSKLITRCLTSGRRVDNIDTLINRITDKDRITDFFNSLNGSLSILDSDRFRFGVGFYSLFEQIEILNSKELNNTVYQFICNVFQHRQYIHQMSSITELSFKYCLKHQQGFLKKMMSFPTFLQSIDVIIEIIALDLDLKTFKTIEKFILSSDNAWRLDRVIYKIKHKLEPIKDHEVYLYINRKYLLPWSKTKPQEEKPVTKTAIEEIRDYYLEDKKYFNPALFPKFIEKFDEIYAELEDSDKAYLLDIIDIVLHNYDPDVFRIEINEVKGNQTSFSHNHDVWFHIELYFKTAYLLESREILQKYRVKFIKTIPRLDIFEHKRLDLVENIVEIIGGLSETDLKTIYTFCIERKDDMLALSGRSFAEIAYRLNIHTLKPILLKLLKNSKVKLFEKQEIVKAFGELAENKSDLNSLTRIFKTSVHDELKDIANSYLVSKFKDPAAISWRFEELKNRRTPFDTDIKYNGARSVSYFEQELDRPEFPKCFYGLSEQSIKTKMLDLLNFSFQIRDTKPFFRYSTYLQSIVYTYFQPNINSVLIAELRKIASSFPIIEQTYSFNNTLDKMVEELYLQQKKNEPFSTAVHSANEILSKTYLPIQSIQELKELILKIFNNEIKILIENDGFYRLSDQLINDPQSQSSIVTEAIIQKTLKIALGKALLENGLRKTDIHREVESMDGKKYDYLISYGLFGPVMVELKLMHNDEIQKPGKRKEYKHKLTQYLRANGDNGIYAIFQIYDNPAQQIRYQKMLSEYKDINGLEIIAMQCFNKSSK
ncbi:hypothetical protein LPB86_11670 [Pedobacter sp. MC2016-14]|uniref:NACHT domain-containing protein n=1 Tax=Pedobacter sp. MC2016-14 TaxID=2897327 RepID=UPI001E305D94|nr:hypothetical protein [Pedobacter sp. MC2016-14]MCD0488890.1 hypothetical protein [Pedobacter sp. MC2016-14]